jgi:hypothetical protein
MPEVGLFGKFTKMSGQKGNRRGHSFNLPISFVLNRRMQIIVEKERPGSHKGSESALDADGDTGWVKYKGMF